MSKVKKVIEHAERLCQNSNARLTQKRKQVLSGLVKADRAMSAYDLIEFCKSHGGDTLPAMSVYRILDFLQEENLVHKLNLANKYIACAHITCDHEHEVPQFLICGKCQRVEEIGISKLTVKELEYNVEKAGFTLSSPQIELDCICHRCTPKH